MLPWKPLRSWAPGENGKAFMQYTMGTSKQCFVYKVLGLTANLGGDIPLPAVANLLLYPNSAKAEPCT